MSENKISSADHKILDDIKPLKALPSFKKFEVRHNLQKSFESKNEGKGNDMKKQQSETKIQNPMKQTIFLQEEDTNLRKKKIIKKDISLLQTNESYILNPSFRSDQIRERDQIITSVRQQQSIRNVKSGIISQLKQFTPEAFFRAAQRGFKGNPFESQIKSVGQISELQQSSFGSQKNLESKQQQITITCQETNQIKSMKSLNSLTEVQNTLPDQIKRENEIDYKKSYSYQKNIPETWQQFEIRDKKGSHSMNFIPHSNIGMEKSESIFNFQQQEVQQQSSKDKQLYNQSKLIFSEDQEGIQLRKEEDLSGIVESKVESKRLIIERQNQKENENDFIQKTLEEEQGDQQEKIQIQKNDEIKDEIQKEESQQASEQLKGVNLELIELNRSIEDTVLSLESNVMSIQTLVHTIKTKLNLKKLWSYGYYLPLCISFFVLALRHAFFFCNLNIFVHLFLYFFLSVRNYILIILFYYKCDVHLKVLEKYETSPLQMSKLFELVSELQQKYKKEQDIKQFSNKDEEINTLNIQFINNQNIPLQLQEEENKVQNQEINHQNNKIEGELIIDQSPLGFLGTQDQLSPFRDQAYGSKQFEQPLNLQKREGAEEKQFEVTHRTHRRNQTIGQSFQNFSISQSNQNEKWVPKSNKNSTKQDFSNISQIISLQQNNVQQIEEIKQDQVYPNVIYSLPLSVFLERENFKQKLLMAPDLTPQRQDISIQTGQTNVLIEEISKIVYIKASDKIERQIEQVIKYPKYPKTAILIQILSYVENFYFVGYSLIIFTLTFCNLEEKKAFLFFAFLYSIALWVQIIIVLFSLCFMIIALIFYGLFMVLSYNSGPSLPTISFKTAKQRLLESGKSSEELKEFNCIICYEDFKEKDQVFLSPCCSRCYHKSCIFLWIKKISNCPLCRTPLKTK